VTSTSSTGRLPEHRNSPADRIRPADLLRALLVARLLLPAFVTHDALVLAAGWPRLRPWHAFLAAVFAALILHTFQIVLFGHRD
jgi:hypothetical protein